MSRAIPTLSRFDFQTVSGNRSNADEIDLTRDNMQTLVDAINDITRAVNALLDAMPTVEVPDE